jgi:hypothetical protein
MPWPLTPDPQWTQDRVHPELISILSEKRKISCVCVLGGTKPWTVWIAYRKNDDINNNHYLLLKDNTFCLLKCLNSDWWYLWWTITWWNYETQNKMHMICAALHKYIQWFKPQTEAIYIILMNISLPTSSLVLKNSWTVWVHWMVILYITVSDNAWE